MIRKKKGLMTEALKAVLNYGFTELKLHRIEALIDAQNEPSLKLLLRYGFSKEGQCAKTILLMGKMKIPIVIPY